MAKQVSPPKPTGRPSSYTIAIGDAICERLADGESLRAICSGEDMPSRWSVLRWLTADEAFRTQYAHAREEQADTLADEIVGIADEQCTMVRADKHGAKADDEDGMVEVVFDSAAVARNRLRVDARKWVASKLKPRKYGEKVEHEVAVKVTLASLIALSGLTTNGPTNSLLTQDTKQIEADK